MKKLNIAVILGLSALFSATTVFAQVSDTGAVLGATSTGSSPSTVANSTNIGSGLLVFCVVALLLLVIGAVAYFYAMQREDANRRA